MQSQGYVCDFWLKAGGTEHCALHVLARMTTSLNATDLQQRWNRFWRLAFILKKRSTFFWVERWTELLYQGERWKGKSSPRVSQPAGLVIKALDLQGPGVRAVSVGTRKLNVPYKISHPGIRCTSLGLLIWTINQSSTLAKTASTSIYVRERKELPCSSSTGEGSAVHLHALLYFLTNSVVNCRCIQSWSPLSAGSTGVSPRSCPGTPALGPSLGTHCRGGCQQHFGSRGTQKRREKAQELTCF